MLEPWKSDIGALPFVFAHFGAAPKNGNRAYAVSARIIGPKGKTASIDSLIAYHSFSGRERYYSNLTREEVITAPDIKTVKGRLASFLKEHQFLLAFPGFGSVEEIAALTGIDHVVDLSFAAEFFVQQIGSHTFKQLWAHLCGKDHPTISFSAAEIVQLGVDLVKHISGTLLNDRTTPHATTVRYFLNKSETLFGDLFCHVTKHFGAYFGGLFEPCGKPDTAKWQQFLPRTGGAHDRGENETEPFRAVNPDEIAARFQTMAETGRGYKLRPAQVAFARLAGQTFNEGAVACIEAGTGTGKTFGYLVPALEFLIRNSSVRVAVSTYTKSLQEQIHTNEIVHLKDLFAHYRDIPVTVLKGKSSYSCSEKLYYVYDDKLNGTKLLGWLYLLINIFNYESADTDTIGETIRRNLDNDRFLSEMILTISAREGCDARHHRCPANAVTQKARNSRLIITNHHKLMLLNQDPVLNGLFKYIVVDEANHFENAVRGAFKTEAGTADIRPALSYLEGMLPRIGRRAAGDDKASVDGCVQALARFKRALGELRQALAAASPDSDARDHSGDHHRLPASHHAYKGGSLHNHLYELTEIAGRIDRQLERLSDRDICRRLKIVDRTAGKLKLNRGLLKAFAEALAVISQSIKLKNSVTSYYLYPKGFGLSAAPVEVNQIVREHIRGDCNSIVFTAATLCHQHRFDAFKGITGLDRPLKSNPADGEDGPERPLFTKILPTPFDPGAVEFVVPADALSGKFDNKSRWLAWLIHKIPDLVAENKGRTLVLFASYDDLNRVAAGVADTIAALDYPLLIQRPGAPTLNLIDEFRTIKESVLFGVDTFWYGVDFRGDTLTQVIITRMPYPNLRNPVYSIRRETLSQQDFWQRYTYDADIKLKQGIGRLIRSETDRGRVVVLDSRFKPEHYRRLPTGGTRLKRSLRSDTDGARIKLVCLGITRNSRGYGVVGKQLGEHEHGAWLRLTHSQPEDWLTAEQISLAEGRRLQPLDVIEVPLQWLKSDGAGMHRAAVVPERRWIMTGRLAAAELENFCDAEPKLWENGYHSRVGVNDVIPADLQTEDTDQGLLLVSAQNLEFITAKRVLGRTRVLVRFDLGDLSYRLIVTDYHFTQWFLEADRSEYYPQGSIPLCVELSPPYEEQRYKLVAGVLARDHEPQTP